MEEWRVIRPDAVQPQTVPFWGEEIISASLLVIYDTVRVNRISSKFAEHSSRRVY